MKKENIKSILELSIVSAFAFGLLILFSALPTVFPKANADTSGNGITKNTIVFECSYGDVTFTHKKHNTDYQIDCYSSDCHHHTLRNVKEKKDLCRDCHKKQAEEDTPSKKDAFHKSCKKCHEDEKKENKPTGPIVCKDCHKKK